MKNKETNKKPIFKKWWFWLIIAVVAVIAIASSGGSDEQTTTSADSQTTVEAQEEQTENKDEATQADETTEAEETTAEEETTEASKYDNMENVYFVGDTLEYDNVEIKYVSAENWKGYSAYAGPKSGNKIIRLEFEIKNNGSSDIFVSCYDFNCYADDTAADAYYTLEDDLSATVSGGRKASGYVYFEVPKDAQYIEVEYETNFWTDKKAIFVVE